ncbi:MAG: glycosyltransferase family 4 protein, partial [Deltaproteobacteria bacterium]|nr:glycosyltransferase family 4 protein [Candidatus Tharpella sp.]
MVVILREAGLVVDTLKTNQDFPAALQWIAKIKGVRTVVSISLFLIHLHKILKKVDQVYFLTGFFNFFFLVTYPALILIKLHRKKVILSVRGGGAREFFKKYGFLVYPILRRVDLITAPSGFLQEIFIEAFGIKPIIVPNIADLEQFSYRKRRPLKPCMLVTRSLEPIYNVQCVIQAFKLVSQQFPESKLGIIGDGSQRRMLESLVRKLGIERNVIFYGRIDHSVIQEFYDEYDILVNGSNVDNFPGVVLEAFASGLPIVSTDAGGIPFMIEHEVTGLLVSRGDYKALARQVIWLLENPGPAEKIADSAYHSCRQYRRENIK